jgi:predicted nucleotidyltransferase
VEYAQSYFLLIEWLEELFHCPIDLVETELIDNPYFKETVEERKVALYGTP